MKKHHLHFLYFLPLCFLLFFCKETEPEKPVTEKVSFKSLGLPNRIVHELTLKDNKLFAATDNGIYSRQLTDNAAWQEVGLQGQPVKSVLFLPDGTCLASVADPATSNFKLYKSPSNSFAFVAVNTNFGGTTPEPINQLTFNPTTNEVLGAGWNVVAKSTDNGTTWTPIYNGWQGMASGLDFVQVNPLNGDIWSGGQNGIEGFTLVKYAKQSNTWQSWINLIESPSVAKDISFDKTNANRLVIGGEDGIIKTEDGGATWSIIKNDHHAARFYFGVDFDQENANKLYAASWQKNFHDPQPLILYISENAGSTWQEYKYEDNNLFGGVWDMLQVKSNGKTKLYLGLYKGGVYEATLNE